MEYKDFIKGKRIAVIGPAPSIIDSNQHDLIESYDLVVRINRGLSMLEARSKDIGSRTDILYNCLNPSNVCGGKQDFELWQKTIQWLCSPYPEIFPFDRDLKRTYPELIKTPIPFHVIDKEHYIKCVNEIQTRPNSGICAIWDLLSFDIAELYITGYTFFQGGYDRVYRDIDEDALMISEARGSHKQPSQIQFVKKLFESDSRLSGDAALVKILQEN